MFQSWRLSVQPLSMKSSLMLYCGIISEHPVRVCIFKATYVRALDRQNIAHGAPFVLKRYVTRVGRHLLRSRTLVPSLSTPHLSFMRFSRVRVRYPFLRNRRAASVITRAGPVENGVGGAAVEIVRRSGVTLFRYGEQFPVL